VNSHPVTQIFFQVYPQNCQGISWEAFLKEAPRTNTNWRTESMGYLWGPHLEKARVKVPQDPMLRWHQGILSVPGITGYEWVPARIGCFGNKKY